MAQLGTLGDLGSRLSLGDIGSRLSLGSVGSPLTLGRVGSRLAILARGFEVALARGFEVAQSLSTCRATTSNDSTLSLLPSISAVDLGDSTDVSRPKRRTKTSDP